MIGKTISHYKILEKLGEGGMGVVYKAEDTKLERTVALKFLSLTSIGDEEKKRFKREAKAAASLNHPNIATIHAIDEADDQTFIAMEYIEGKSLEELVGANGGKPMPIDKAIDYATQTAAGLQAAHKKGITHRDIKSANIMITEDDQVKIMDFGLAKLANRSKLTQLGTTLGTAAYMSPEQSRGENTDHRSDIWSLGVVLYEMISGQMPFKGDYEQAVIYSIQNEEPEPLTALRSGVPIALDGIIAKALAKDPKTRYQHVDELPADLKALDTAALSRSRIATTNQPPAGSKLAGASRLLWVLFGIALLTLVVLAVFWQTTQRHEPRPVTRFTIPLPVEHAVTYGTDWVQQAVSPDGRKIVYVTQTLRGVSQLYLRDLEEIEPTPISGTEGGYDPFFSPDGQWIGFRGSGRLWKISLFGGKPLSLCSAPGGLTAAWGNGTIIFTPQFNLGLWQVSEDGGEPKPLTEPDETEQEAGHRFPQILPDGEHVLFTIKPPSSNFDEATIATLSLKTGKIKRLFTGGSFARYLPTGHLVYMLDQKLMAAAFDLDRLEVVGTPVKLLESVTYNVHFGSPQLAFSNSGALVYLPQNRGPANVRLAWLDRSGKASLISKELGRVHSASLSPDGKWVALGIATPVSEKIALLELKRQVVTHLTADPEQHDTLPFWTPDGERIIFRSVGLSEMGLYWKRRDGTGDTQHLVLSNALEGGGSWSPDGNVLVYSDAAPKTLNDIWLFNYPEKRVEMFWGTTFQEIEPAFSPDGRWIAYCSNESGVFDIYLRPFPAKEPKVSISNDGGRAPFWSRDGSELFYLNGRRLMVVPMQLQPKLKPGIPKELFELPPGIRLANGMSKDGQKFLALQSEAEKRRRAQHLVVVQNWFEELKQKVPVEK